MPTESMSMVEYSESLRRLPADELARETARLVGREHGIVARVIAHLAEISSRKLHLDLGCRSLFDYCLKKLGLTEGSTALRIQVANVCRRCPAILTAIEEGHVSLTVAGKLAPHLTAANQRELIQDCHGMTKREVEEYLVRLAPKPPVAPAIARQPQGRGRPERPTPTPPPRGHEAGPFSPPEQPKATDAPRPQPAGHIEPCQPELFNVRFPASQDFKNKLERLAEVLNISNPHGNIAAVLEAALDVAIDKKDPQKRQERREQRAAKQKAKPTTTPAQQDAAVASKTSLDEVSAQSRAVPQPLRDQLLARAGFQCEYQTHDGTRCSARTHLAIDHIVPYARGGSTTPGNLRVLCTPHNQRYAERCYGWDFMADKIAQARDRVSEQLGTYLRSGAAWEWRGGVERHTSIVTDLAFYGRGRQ